MRKICIVTGTRAEYGLLKPLIRKIEADPDLELQLIACAMHLSPTFGYTVQEIEKDGFKISKRVECLLSSDSAVGVSKSIALAVSGFADVYADLQPDLVVVLGDRTEILASVIAASVANIPIAHLHGGETTEGAYDEAIRHSITKFSHLHFASTEVYRQRIIQLGEQPDTVFNVGAIAIDSIKNLPLLSKEEFEQSIHFQLDKRNLLITYHPVTLEKNSPAETFANLLRAVDALPDTHLIFTHANSDKNGQIINEMIKNFVAQHPNKAVEIPSLGQLRYLSALQYVDAVVGNSSSGVSEVPAFHIPTVNIGDRQKGRLMPESVINCGNSYEEIQHALAQALDPDFVEQTKHQPSLFGEGTAAEQMLTIIKNHQDIALKKSFYDLKTDKN